MIINFKFENTQTHDASVGPGMSSLWRDGNVPNLTQKSYDDSSTVCIREIWHEIVECGGSRASSSESSGRILFAAYVDCPSRVLGSCHSCSGHSIPVIEWPFSGWATWSCQSTSRNTVSILFDNDLSGGVVWNCHSEASKWVMRTFDVDINDGISGASDSEPGNNIPVPRNVNADSSVFWASNGDCSDGVVWTTNLQDGSSVSSANHSTRCENISLTLVHNNSLGVLTISSGASPVRTVVAQPIRGIWLH
jgi:hypothetical protein